MKPFWRTTLFASLVVSSLFACARAPAVGSDHGELEAALHRWLSAVNSQDTATLTSTMTADVELSDEATTAKGRAAAITRLRDLATRGQLVTTTHELTVASDVAWHVAGLVQTGKDGVSRPAGRALEIWKRVDDAWRLHRRMATGAPDSAELLARPPTKEPALDRPDR